MKKLFAILLIVGLLSGCAANSFLCKNKDSILSGLQSVINTAGSIINVVEASYPGVVPPLAAAVIAQAQLAKNVAAWAAAKACPTVEDLAKAQSELQNAQMSLAVAVKYQGLKLGR